MIETPQGTLLQVAQLGHPMLRTVASEVSDVHAPEVQTLIDNMITTVMDVNGVGIAAPQVYRSERVFIVASHPNPRYPHAPEMEPTAMINPRIVEHPVQTVKDWEGCLSIPGVRGLVPRWDQLEMEKEYLRIVAQS
jgi:peptide deformylase